MSESPAVTPATDTPDETTPTTAELVAEYFFRCACGDPGCDREGYAAEVLDVVNAALRDEVGRLRTERDAASRTIENLRGVITEKAMEIKALRALHADTADDARTEANTVIDAWGSHFHAQVAWELETDGDVASVMEAWEQLVRQMAVAKSAAALRGEAPTERPDCGHPDCVCCRSHSACRDGCGSCTEPTGGEARD